MQWNEASNKAETGLIKIELTIILNVFLNIRLLCESNAARTCVLCERLVSGFDVNNIDVISLHSIMYGRRIQCV